MPKADRLCNHFSLPPAAMSEMRQHLDKRAKRMFSEGLSPEGKIAMQSVREDIGHRPLNVDSVFSNETTQSINEVLSKSAIANTNDRQRQKLKETKKKQISFADAYRNSSSVRLEGDITDKQFSEAKLKKKTISGEHFESALERIEIVTHENRSTSNGDDTTTVEDKLKLSALEKCLVWMEVHDTTEQSETASTIGI